MRVIIVQSQGMWYLKIKSRDGSVNKSWAHKRLIEGIKPGIGVATAR